MHKTTLAAASLALCAAMPAAVDAQATRDGIRFFCKEATAAGNVFSDLPDIVHEQYGKIGYAECLSETSEMVIENEFMFKTFNASKWLELGPEGVFEMVNWSICVNRHLNDWELTTECAELFDSQ